MLPWVKTIYFINTLHPTISMYILYTIIYTFLKVLRKGEFVLQSRASVVGDHFLYSPDHKLLIQQYYCKEKLDAGHS